MLAAVLIPVNDHDTAAPAAIVPALAAPATVPAPVAYFIRTVCQGAFGQRVARGRRIGDVLLSDVSACFSIEGILPRGRLCLRAVADLGLDMLTRQFVGDDVAHCARCVESLAFWGRVLCN